MKVNNKIYWTFLFIGLWSAANAQTGWEERELKGEVKTFTQVMYTAVMEGTEIQKGEEESRTEITFNQDGFPTEEERKSSQMRQKTLYDDNGRVLKMQVWGAGGEIVRQEILTYDEEGKLTEKAEFQGEDKLLFKTVYQYDAEGNKIEEQEYDGDNQPAIKTVYQYDNRGNCTGYTELFPDGGQNKREYVYDEQNNRIEEYRYDEEGEIVVKRIFEYDAQNRLIREGDELNQRYVGRHNFEEYQYDENGNQIERLLLKESGEHYQKIEFTYDQENRLTQECWYDELNQILLEKIWRYDAKGNLSQYNVKNPKAETEEIRYRYDDRGNSIEQIVEVDGRPQHILRNEIVYY